MGAACPRFLRLGPKLETRRAPCEQSPGLPSDLPTHRESEGLNSATRARLPAASGPRLDPNQARGVFVLKQVRPCGQGLQSARALPCPEQRRAARSFLCASPTAAPTAAPAVSARKQCRPRPRLLLPRGAGAQASSSSQGQGRSHGPGSRSRAGDTACPSAVWAPPQAASGSPLSGGGGGGWPRRVTPEPLQDGSRGRAEASRPQ